MHLEHERYDLGMDALVIVCTWNTNVMVWAWMLWLSYALGTGSLSWFAHGCSGYRIHSNIEKRGICHISGPRNTSNVCFLQRRPLRRGRPSMHFLRVYTLPQLLTMIMRRVRVGSQIADAKHGFIKL